MADYNTCLILWDTHSISSIRRHSYYFFYCVTARAATIRRRRLFEGSVNFYGIQLVRYLTFSAELLLEAYSANSTAWSFKMKLHVLRRNRSTVARTRWHVAICGCGRSALIGMRRLFEGGNNNTHGLVACGYHLKAATIRGRRLFKEIVMVRHGLTLKFCHCLSLLPLEAMTMVNE